MDWPFGDTIPLVSALTGLGLALLLAVLIPLFARPSGRLEQGHLTSSSGSKKGNAVLLVGPGGAGKTSVFAKLAYGAVPTTHTSLRESTTLLASGHTLVDIPGAARLRTRPLVQRLETDEVAGVGFVIDSKEAVGVKGVREAAEHFQLLLTLLCLSASTGGAPPQVLILLHDSSAPLSLSTTGSLGLKPTYRSALTTEALLTRAQTTLAREMERRRVAASAAAAAGGGAAKLEGLETVALGEEERAARRTFGGILRGLFGGGAPTAKPQRKAKKKLPQDESEILASSGEELFAYFQGSEFGWEELGKRTGIEVQWKVVKPRLAEDESGTQGVRDWLGDL